MHELGSPVHAKSFLKTVLINYGKRARLGITEYENKMIGMGIILLGDKGVSIPWASTLRDYNRLGPNMLLYWNFLKYSADEGYEYFDFGRSSEGEGTFRFKRQWGATPIPLNWYELKSCMKQKTKNKNDGKDKREKIAEFWKKLPIHIANMIGPYLRRYISL